MTQDGPRTPRLGSRPARLQPIRLHPSALNTFDSRLYLPTPPLPNQPHQRTSGPARAHWQMAAVAGLNCPNRSTTQNYKKFTQKLQTLNLKLYYRPPSFSNVCLFDENYYSELSKKTLAVTAVMQKSCSASTNALLQCAPRQKREHLLSFPRFTLEAPARPLG